MKAGSKFSCCYKHLKLRFYSSFNALNRRSYSSHSELLSVTAVILLASYIVWFRGNRATEICTYNAQQLDQQSCT